jgi:hypothetical protein
MVVPRNIWSRRELEVGLWEFRIANRLGLTPNLIG